MKKTVPYIFGLKDKRVISMITAYDYPTSKAASVSEIDIILVGDSLAQVVLGHDDTLSITVEEMLHHVKAVSNAKPDSLVVADMPYMSYHISIEETIRNASRFIKEGKADAVKIEGGSKREKVVKALINAEIPVMGHLGLLPQTAQKYTVQGKTKDSALELIEDAEIITKSGVFSIVLEMVSSQVAKIITEKISVPTIGIGSGKFCDGQVLVVHDMLGLFEKIKPKFAKRYLSLADEIRNAVKSYTIEVKEQKFPDIENEFQMEESEYNKLRKEIE